MIEPKLNPLRLLVEVYGVDPLPLNCRTVAALSAGGPPVGEVLEDQAFLRARRVDMALAELCASEGRVADVLDHLTSRAVGTFWTQALGAVVKS